jgi:heat shock protein beta
MRVEVRSLLLLLLIIVQ